MPAPLDVVRAVQASLEQWLESARKLADPTAQPSGTVEQLAAQILSVDEAIRSVTPAVAKSAEWKAAVESYVATLHEVRARLNNLEITLRIRQSQMRDAKTTVGAARSWLDLVRHVG